MNAVFNTVERYNPDQRVWQPVASMSLKRGGVAAVTLNGDVFAIGGNDGDMTKSSVERYRYSYHSTIGQKLNFSPLVDRWEEMPSMRYRRAGSSAAVYNGKIYVAGGFDDVSPLEKCECFDPVEKTWVEIAPLQEPRGGVGLAELQGTGCSR